MLLLSGIAHGAAVYSQPATDVFLRNSSQLGPDRFASDYDVYVWDDFTLATTQSITEVDWRGAYTFGGYWGGAVSDFVIGFYASIAAGTEPNVVDPPLVEYIVGSNAGETPPLAPGGLGLSFHDYRFVLPSPFVAAAGTKYWVQIEGVQNGATDWGLAAASAGSGGIFFAQAGAGDFQFFAAGGNVGFTLIGPDGPGVTPTATATATATAVAPSATPTVTNTPAPTALSGKKMQLADRAGDPTKRKIIFLSSDANVRTVPGSGIDPVANGAALQVYNANGSGESVCIPLPSTGWQASGAAQSPTFKYRDTGFANGPCKLAVVKDGKLLKIKCAASVKPIAYSLNEPAQGAIGVRFTSGNTTWCALFGGTVTPDSGTDPPIGGGKGLFKAKLAPAPAGCAVPPAACP